MGRALSSRIEMCLGWCGPWQPGGLLWIALFRSLWGEECSGSHIIMDQRLWREVKFLLNPIYYGKLPSEVSRPEWWEQAASSKSGSMWQNEEPGYLGRSPHRVRTRAGGPLVTPGHSGGLSQTHVCGRNRTFEKETHLHTWVIPRLGAQTSLQLFWGSPKSLVQSSAHR